MRINPVNGSAVHPLITLILPCQIQQLNVLDSKIATVIIFPSDRLLHLDIQPQETNPFPKPNEY